VRDYPAISIKGRVSKAGSAEIDAEEHDPLDLLLAELHDLNPTAVEELPDGLRAFFVTADDRDRAIAHLRLHADLTCEPIDVPDDDWAARSQAALQPITVGRVTVAPPWTVTDDLRARASQLIVIQPSMGFGTGHHASTRLCLDWLQRTSLDRAAVLDVGTGSGVLAIAAIGLGAASVTGIDVDPDALTAARDNGDRNPDGSRIDWWELDLSAAAGMLSRTFDVICANLTGGLLVRDAPTLTALASPGGHLIASGFQSHESAYVIEAFRVAGWRLDGHIEEDDWVGARLRRDDLATGRNGASAV
jgi:ribosomal protein L11 methyltransferase